MQHDIEIAEPVDGGYEFWAINDLTLNQNLVTIHKSVPNAEKIIEEIETLLQG